MTTEKLTIEVVINTLEKMYLQRFFHEDFQELNQKKLKVINNVLFEEELISFKTEKNKSYFIFNSKRTDIDINYANYMLNDLFEKLTREHSMCRGELTTTKEIIDLQTKVDLFRTNIIVSSHVEQINKEYRILIKNLLNYLYSNICFSRLTNKDINENKLSKTIFHINNYLSKEDSEILNKNLSEYDYF